MRGAGFSGLTVVLLAACGGAPSGGDSVAVSGSVVNSVSAAVAGGGICPSPDPVRDGPLVDAIRTRDPVAARALARDPADTRAEAALALIGGRRPEANEAACFAPYLT